MILYVKECWIAVQESKVLKNWDFNFVSFANTWSLPFDHFVT